MRFPKQKNKKIVNRKAHPKKTRLAKLKVKVLKMKNELDAKRDASGFVAVTNLEPKEFYGTS